MEVLHNGFVAWKEPRDKEGKGALQACRERHIRTACARCGECIEESEIMYSRDGTAWFCSLTCDQEDQKRIRADKERSDKAHREWSEKARNAKPAWMNFELDDGVF